MSRLTAVPDGPDGEPDRGAPRADLDALLRRCARGDEDAFAAVYGATAPRAYGLVLRIVRNPALAEEVTQEVYLEAWRTSGRFDARKGSALAWLMTMAHRRAVDRVRATEAAGRNEESYERRTSTVAHDSTAEVVEARLEAKQVRDALDSLNEVQRAAIDLAYFGGYTHTEVARLLDLPLGTAKTRIRDGLIRMRDAIGVTP